MFAAARPFTTGAVAVVGATAIAMSPVAPPVAQLHLPSIPTVHAAEVALSAAVNPITELINLVTTTATNLGTLGSDIGEDGLPIIEQIVANQTAAINTLTGAVGDAVGGIISAIANTPQTMVTVTQQLAAGNFQGAVNTVWGFALGSALPLIAPVFAVVDYAVGVLDNVTKVVDTVASNLLLVGLGVITPVSAAVLQVGQSGQTIIDDFRAGDLVGAFTNAINAPVAVTNAFLNGEGGLLTSYGPIAALNNLRNAIADALSGGSAMAATSAAKVASDDVAAVPKSAAATLSLATATAAAEAPAAAKDKAAANEHGKRTSAWHKAARSAAPADGAGKSHHEKRAGDSAKSSHKSSSGKQGGHNRSHARSGHR